MKTKEQILKDFQESRAILIAQTDPSNFLMGWVQAMAYVLGEDCS